MKINLEDIQSVEKNPIDLFYDGLRAEATKERYTRMLKHQLHYYKTHLFAQK